MYVWEIFPSSYISSISFFSVLRFNSHKSFTYITRFVPWYFNFLMLLGNVLLAPFHYQFFWHLVIGLHLTTLLKAYSTYRCSPIEFYALKYAIISTLIKDTVISFLPISITFSSCFSCFIALVKTSSTVINRYIESRQSCIFPYFSEIALSFPQFALILAKDCCKMPLLYYCISLVSLTTPGLL